MTTTISPSSLIGSINAPASKSITQRAFAAALLRGGETILYNTGFSTDEQVALQILRQAGCIISNHGNGLKIDSSNIFWINNSVVNFGESGLASRMFMPLLSVHPTKFNFTGTGSLLNRPMNFLTDTLTALGVSVTNNNSILPISLQGPLIPANITIDGSVSSQSVTGLIMAYIAAGADDVSIKVENPVSTPYLALTLKVLNEMGLPTPQANNDFSEFHFKKRAVKPSFLEYTIEGDWSSAAMLMVAAAIAGKVVLNNLNVFSEQGDKAILQPLMETGAELSISTDQITVSKTPLKPFHFNATNAPDLFPPLAVLGAYAASGTSVIEGVHRLQHKESNRALTLQSELGKMGVKISFQDDLMLIEGGAKLRGTTVNSHGDHRIAMACAIAALGAEGKTFIQDSETVKKSYPQFFEDLQSLGATLSSL